MAVFEVHAQYGKSLKIRAMRPAEPGEYNPLDLQDGPTAAYGQMVDDLRALVATIQKPALRRLLDSFFAEGSEVWQRWSTAPAAKKYHQAYRHGLLEHCLSVAQGVSAISATFPGIDRDIAVAGALLHDIGKIDAYETVGGAHDLTDTGKLHGEIPLGYYRVRRAIEETTASRLLVRCCNSRSSRCRRSSLRCCSLLALTRASWICWKSRVASA